MTRLWPLLPGRPGARSAVLAAVVAAVLALALAAGGDGSTAGSGRTGSGATTSDPASGGGKDAATELPLPTPAGAAPLPTADPVSCPPPTVIVRTADELESALAGAAPGASIHMADGVYAGSFVAATSGTRDQPVWLCGGPGAVLDGQGITRGYGLHLAPAQYWRVVGFTVRNAQKGVVADATRGTTIQDLTVQDIGDEGIHLRTFSTGSAVLNNTVRRTGLRNEKFGEGVYVGSAESNWETYSGGQPDRSDNVLVHGNRISQTTSESVDIKEGTTGGVLSGNTFDGAGTTAADSWVDVKGNGWLISGNTGAQASQDGYQTHQILDGWGTDNVFRRNTARTRGSGVDIYIHKPEDTANQVYCDNRDAGGAAASSNVQCLP